MVKIDFRATAREHSKKAKELLDSNCDADVPYAALELRKSIEALAYERVQNYESDISPENLKKWQAPKVIAVVAAIDPGINYIRKMSVEVETDDGDTDWMPIGTEHPLLKQILEKDYHALGSYLHMPTLHQIKSGNDHDMSKGRAKCEEILSDLQKILAITNWSFSMRQPIKFQCQRSGCDSTINRNVIALIPGDLNNSADSMEIECFKCDATYKVRRSGENEFQIDPLLTSMTCQHDGCRQLMEIWHADARNALSRKTEFTQTCGGCNQKSKVVLGISPC